MRSTKNLFITLSAIVVASLAYAGALSSTTKDSVASKTITAIQARPTTSVAQLHGSKELIQFEQPLMANAGSTMKKFRRSSMQSDLTAAAGEKKYMLVKKKPKMKKIKMEVYKPKMKYKKIKMKVPVKKMKKKKVKGYMVKKHHGHEY